MINNSQVSLKNQYRSQNTNRSHKYTTLLIKASLIISVAITIFAATAASAMYFKLPSQDQLVSDGVDLIAQIKINNDNQMLQQTQIAQEQIEQNKVKIMMEHTNKKLPMEAKLQSLETNIQDWQEQINILHNEITVGAQNTQNWVTAENKELLKEMAALEKAHNTKFQEINDNYALQAKTNKENKK